MDINTLSQFFTAENIVGIGIKLFGIVFSFLFFIFALVLIKQVQVMGRTIRIKSSGIVVGLAIFQFLLSVVLVLYSLFIL
jgi:hypothetical protein